MTLNNAVASYRSNANCTVDEPSRFNYSMWLDPKIRKFIPFGSFEASLWDNRLLKNSEGTPNQNWCDASLRVGDCPNVVGFRRNRDFNAESFLYENAISMGCSKTKGGGRSVMLVAFRILFLLGFRNVYLLGVDFEMSPDMRYHFPEERSINAVRGNMATYAKMQVRLKDLQPHFLAEKFIVKNCNPTSRLEVFPHISFDEALQEATGLLGDYSSEKTIGMYTPKKDKPGDPDASTSY